MVSVIDNVSDSWACLALFADIVSARATESDSAAEEDFEIVAASVIDNKSEIETDADFDTVTVSVIPRLSDNDFVVVREVDMLSAIPSESEILELDPPLTVIALFAFASFLLAARSCTASARISSSLVASAFTDVFWPAVRVIVIVVPSTAVTVAPDKEISLVLPV